MSGRPNSLAAALVLIASACSEPTVTTLAYAQNTPWGIAVHGDFVYWVDEKGGTVMRVSRAGGTPTILASGRYGPMYLTVDDDNVYWTNGGVDGSGTVGVMSVPLSGGAVTTLAVTSGAGEIAVDASSVYWLDFNGLHKIAKAGGASITLDPNVQLFGDLIVDGGTAYYGGYPLFEVSTNGGQPTQLAANAAPMALDEGFLYWTESWGHAPDTTSELSKMSIDGDDVVTLASGAGNWSAIALRDGQVYLADYDNGTISKVSTSGGTPQVIATGQHDPHQIAVDGDSVYWTNLGDGTVMKVTPR